MIKKNIKEIIILVCLIKDVFFVAFVGSIIIFPTFLKTTFFSKDTFEMFFELQNNQCSKMFYM